jgi:ADP-ribosyl-[dinitrogen reductase] hydrolase
MKSRDILLCIAVGDALAAGCEYANENVAACASLQGYVKHPKHPLPPGSYTDDTQMSLANAEFMLQDLPLFVGCKVDKHVVEYWMDSFHRDQREGYSGHFYLFLLGHTEKEEFLKDIISTSDKSGGAMRAGVFGFLEGVDRVKFFAEWQASFTHNSVIGRNSAACAALAVHHFRNGGTKVELMPFLKKHIPDFGPDIQWEDIVPWNGKVRAQGYMHVAAAITAILESNSYSDVLRKCCEFTGDTDTVAAIAMAAASQCQEIDPEIPDVLFETLENGQYGRDYLIKVSQELEQRYALSSASVVAPPS